MTTTDPGLPLFDTAAAKRTADPWPVVLAGFAVAVSLCWPMAARTWATGDFLDTDDAMRMVQVRAWLAGQGWFDLTAWRLDPPTGSLMHWSRVVDLPIALLLKLFGLFAAPEQAERLARIAYPLLLQIALLRVMAGIGHLLMGTRGAVCAVVLTVLSGFMLGQFVPGRVDHHSMQILLLMCMIGALLAALDPMRQSMAAIAAACLALSLSISLENLPFMAIVVAALPAAWAWVGQPLAPALRNFGLGLLAALPLCFGLFHAGADRWQPACDAFSIAHLLPGLAGALACLGLSVSGRVATSRLRRVGLLVGAGLGVSAELKLAHPIPKLCALVTGSPFDAALNDAYGKLHGRNIFDCYSAEFMNHDLSHFIGSQFKGEYADRYVLKTPKPTMPLYHLVGAVDPLTQSDVVKPIGDGLPEHLAQWIEYSGLTHMKIKLNGEDNKWDSERVLAVDRVATEVQRKRGVTNWVYSLDFNEKCPNVGYLVEFLKNVKQKAPSAFDRIQYVEQPTKRDLQSDRANVMHEASKIRPVVIDESLTGQDALMLCREMGYTGAALKACKGQSQAVLMAAICQKYKMFLCVQDLTCPGASLIHSASIAAHIPGVAAIEANSRQYVPAANKGWDAKFPGVFDVHNGKMNTALLNGPGLGAVA